MIETKTRYYVKCDKCGYQHGNSGATIPDIESNARHNDWVTVSDSRIVGAYMIGEPITAEFNKHYCPKCKLTNGVEDD